MDDSEFLETGRCKLAYRIEGRGPALLWVHAGIADGRMWESQVAFFAQHYRVIRPDLRGYGSTVKPAEPFAHHGDLRRLLEHLGVDTAVVVGASMGGAAAIDLCLEHPDLVGALALVGSALGGVAFTDPWLKAQEEAAEAAFDDGDVEAAAQIEMKTWLAGESRSLSDIDAGVTDRLKGMLLRSYELDVDAEERELSPPAASRLAEIRVPTLVIVGAGDVSDMHHIADLLANEIKGAEKFVVAGAAHLPNMEKSARFNRNVLQFLRRAVRL